MLFILMVLQVDLWNYYSLTSNLTVKMSPFLKQKSTVKKEEEEKKNPSITFDEMFRFFTFAFNRKSNLGHHDRVHY